MPTAPKNNEERLRQVLNAWKTLAAGESFAGMTAEQYEAAIGPSFTIRQQLNDLDNQRTHLLNSRNDADEASLTKTAAVVAGVQAHPAFGPNSSLYEAMGYRRKSERKSGLHKGSGATPSGGGTPPTNP